MKGWYKESYRHYLAAKGVTTKKYFARNKYYKDMPIKEISEMKKEIGSALEKRREMPVKEIPALEKELELQILPEVGKNYYEFEPDYRSREDYEPDYLSMEKELPGQKVLLEAAQQVEEEKHLKKIAELREKRKLSAEVDDKIRILSNGKKPVMNVNKEQIIQLVNSLEKYKTRGSVVKKEWYENLSSEKKAEMAKRLKESAWYKERHPGPSRGRKATVTLTEARTRLSQKYPLGKRGRKEKQAAYRTWRSSERGKQYMREYMREYMKDYSKKPDVLRKRQEYMKRYNAQPKNRLKMNEYQKNWYWRHKGEQ